MGWVQKDGDRVSRTGQYGPVRGVLLFLLLSIPGGCVSSAVDTNDFRSVDANQVAVEQPAGPVDPEGPASSQTQQPVDLAATGAQTGEPVAAASAPPAPTAQPSSFQTSDEARAKGVEIIRQKAASQPGEKPQVGPVPETATKPLSKAEQQEKIREMSEAAQASQSQVSEEELQARRRAADLLKRKARSHYDEALKGIEQ